MRGILVKGTLLLAVAVQALAPAWAENLEEVVLRDGRRYKISTEKGMPVPFKSRQIEVTGLGPIFNPSGRSQWAFNATLYEKGTFVVTATTPLDARVATTFECAGPGDIKQLLFGNDEYPTLWEWYDEPSTSWVPIVFDFKSKDSNIAFQVTQWTKFDASVKVLIKRKLKELR